LIVQHRIKERKRATSVLATRWPAVASRWMSSRMSDHPEDTLHCMEILGGNRAARQTIHAPGVDLWIDSRPLESGAGGGDVHYVSTCGGGQVTRLALADVSGHGASVDGPALFLRQLMRKYINTLNQTRFAQALNQEFASAAESGRFATALLLTYFAPTRHLIVCNAGHGRPLRYSAQKGSWEALDLERAGDCSSIKKSKVRYHFERVSNLPLGVLDPIDYEQFAIDFGAGDLVLLYTDAVIESEDADGKQLGEGGLLSIASSIHSTDLNDVGERLLAAVDAHRGTTAQADDQTLILLQRTDAPAAGLPLIRTVSNLAKMLGLRRV
jgi:serine phosphatase RsbU (regulator of sigma subunit)